jgi:hypothetical protein
VGKLFLGFLFLFFTLSAIAAGSGITYNGRLLDPSGNAVVSNNVQFKLQIRTPGNENCLMYEEIQSKDMTNSDGVFSITINDGTGSRTDSTGFTLDQLFANRGSFNFPGGYCVTGSVYNTTPTDGRKLQVYFNDGSFATGQWEPTPAMAINFIPMAIEAQQVGGYKKEQILKLADGVTTTGSELDATKWTSLQALINGTSTLYSKPTDQVTQLYGAAIPAPANGQSIRWNTTLNAGSGGWENFTAGSASAVTSVSSANTDIAVANGSTTPQLTLNSGTGANQIVKLNGTAQLPAVDGANLTNVSASKIVGTAISIASLANGQVLKYNGANWVNTADADALGGLSCANGRVAYYTGGSWACLEVTSGNTINSIVSRDGSGISNFGTVNAGTLKLNDGVSGEISLTTPITVTSYAMKLPSSVGTAGQVLTTDGNSPAQLSWASTSSQWTTSASDIYYNTGKVGIGTSTPAQALHVNGNIFSTIGFFGSQTTYDAARGPAALYSSKIDGVSGRFITGASGKIQFITWSGGTNYADVEWATNDGAGTPTQIRAGGDSYGIKFRMQNQDRMTILPAGNVGIGLTAPVERLEINGAVKIGSTSNSNPGTIRWDGVNFQGYNGSSWFNFLPQSPDVSSCDTTQSFSSAGTFAYNVPSSFGTITVRLWGGGGGGGAAYSGTSAGGGGIGGNSSINSLGLVAGGGVGGVGTQATSIAGASGGSASGGDVNTNGSSSAAVAASGASSGGSSPNGGNGGVAQPINVGGQAGTAPGGGGSGSVYGATASASGGGSGSYVEKVFTTGTLAPGTNIADIVVGGAGSGACHGVCSGMGAVGRVTITCASAGSTPANDRGVVFWESGKHDSVTNFVYSSSGNLGIGTTTPTQRLQVGDSADGTVALANAWNTFSDKRLKKNFERIPAACEKLEQINGYYYNWRSDKDTSRQLGVIAQEVEEVFPELVKVNKDGIRSVDYSKLSAVLIEANKELYSRLKAAEADSVNMKRENELIKERLERLEKVILNK